MKRTAYCPACHAHQNGVKSRIPLKHSCGLQPGEIKIKIPAKRYFKLVDRATDKLKSIIATDGWDPNINGVFKLTYPNFYDEVDEIEFSKLKRKL
jgi:hypothetical protein